MNTRVSILHNDYPESVREKVEERLQHVVKFFDRTQSLRVLLERQGDLHRVEVVAHVARAGVLVAEAKEESLAGSIDQALDRMVKQLKRHHDKLTRERHRGGRIGH